MGNAGDDHQLESIIDQVKHPVLTHSQPPFILETDQLPATRWAGIIFKLGDRCFHPIANLRRKPSEITPRGREK